MGDVGKADCIDYGADYPYRWCGDGMAAWARTGKLHAVFMDWPAGFHGHDSYGFRDAHVIIGTRLEKPSKINGFALLSPIFLSHAGWREDGAVHINTYYTESQMGLCA